MINISLIFRKENAIKVKWVESIDIDIDNDNVNVYVYNSDYNDKYFFNFPKRKFTTISKWKIMYISPG